MSVKIYTTPTCVYCRMAKEYFEKMNVAYEEYDVATDVKAREEMLKKSHQFGVPVVDVNGEIFVGFNRPAIERALGLKK